MSEPKTGREGSYGERWGVYMGKIRGGSERPFVQGSDAEGEFDKIICGVDLASSPPLPMEEIERRMKRAAACVNALSGIEDPAAWREAVEELVEAATKARGALAESMYATGAVARGACQIAHRQLSESLDALALVQGGRG